MSCENIFKDVTAIHARLFHHKPALQGHINFFLKEFEERRGEREVLRMNSTYKNMSYISEQGLPNSTEALHQCLANLKESVSSATAQCQEICDREGKTCTQGEEKPNSLSTERERRAKEWNDFIGLQCERSATVDEEYTSQIEALRSHYSDLENKLRSKPNSLSTERERRAKEWNDFIGLQCERSATVDEEYTSQIEALRSHYSDLENKLRSKVVL